MEEKDVTGVEDEKKLDEQVEKEDQTADSEVTIEEEGIEPDSEATELEAELAKVQQEKEELYQRLLRTQAEFDNYKKRSIKEREAERKYKAQDLVTELLPAIDNFERALQVETTDANKNLLDGISMVYRQLVDALKSQGVEPIEAIGKEFDPNIHQAVMQVEEEGFEPNTVVEELQKGYMMKDRVIRPAMVKVNQ
ncbi:nucleotide exchange factor GrpE [Ornithinibacillus sp. BX22]|uniref:Protein GrpE n=2 Tax=Ornithinibacillus TaxID=484508 RepID=A0A923L9J1_9BACI|nr:MULTISPECIES: nucleotide exchange factor GrpE [Ornithinibacillus]MBC5638789.1 nucleotide exchange factor GrpE [Ornithinibacillus hominis]MBS3679531.1 nucleotide exchange factor GrpE [Ornithinibacillus massiliensis]